MKRTLTILAIGALSLAVTAQGADFSEAQKARAARKSSAAQQTTSARTGAATVKAQRNYSTQRFQRNYSATPRNDSSAVVRQNNMRANRIEASRTRNISSRNAVQARTRNNVTVNRERNLNVNRQRNFAAERNRNLSVNRERNVNRNVTVNRNVDRNINRNINVNRTRNVTVTNNWRGERFSGRNYTAFRNYHREWHNRGWWHSHYPRITFVFGAPYYWNAGYWYPAWGYNPGYTYMYDGPIYGYNDLSPDQVVMNVQDQLSRDGYYAGPIDGQMGPMTRQAIADYQADHGLAVTASVDEPTLENLGLV